MILLTRFNGPPLAINSDLIERTEATPDTVLTLIDGTTYVVRETVAEVIDKVREFRASVLVTAAGLEQQAQATPGAGLRLITDQP